VAVATRCVLSRAVTAILLAGDYAASPSDVAGFDRLVAHDVLTQRRERASSVQ
jgi:hypothetical protein